MRNRFDNQLEKLNNELIEMGSMIEQAIEKAISALVNSDVELAKTVIEGDEDIDHQERRVESLCMKLLLQQQPVAKDFRLISSALKMITDMERIGDHAADISEMTVWIHGENYVTHLNLLVQRTCCGPKRRPNPGRTGRGYRQPPGPCRPAAGPYCTAS